MIVWGRLAAYQAVLCLTHPVVAIPFQIVDPGVGFLASHAFVKCLRYSFWCNSSLFTGLYRLVGCCYALRRIGVGTPASHAAGFFDLFKGSARSVTSAPKSLRLGKIRKLTSADIEASKLRGLELAQMEDELNSCIASLMANDPTKLARTSQEITGLSFCIPELGAAKNKSLTESTSYAIRQKCEQSGVAYAFPDNFNYNMRKVIEFCEAQRLCAALREEHPE